jgi:hypothetical protein
VLTVDSEAINEFDEWLLAVSQLKPVSTFISIIKYEHRLVKGVSNCPFNLVKHHPIQGQAKSKSIEKPSKRDKRNKI